MQFDKLSALGGVNGNAAHTNAFKVNEDVVIPLSRLADYSEGIERINIEQSTRNKLAIIAAVRDYLSGEQPERHLHRDYQESAEGDAIIANKRDAALALLDAVSARWQKILLLLDARAADHRDLIGEDLASRLQPDETLFTLLQRRELRISYRKEVERPLKEIYAGRELEGVREKLDTIHREKRASRLFVATHMHAGEGNVHTSESPNR